ncbi:hypothetical protein L4D20_13450 [Vibrio kyushuensis]|uniref:hypothetical protein n=1 Tax=Vibrio kyushuensis TaxID=2910249 RepID=UPI003D0A8F3A
MSKLLILALFSVSHVYATTLEIIDSSGHVYSITEQDFSSLPTSQLTTWLPWHNETKTYSGVRMENLITAYDSNEISSLTLQAKNGYQIAVKYRMLVLHEAILVNKVNFQPLPEKRGPYWLLFDVSKYPITTNQYFRDQMIWQVKTITIN